MPSLAFPKERRLLRRPQFLRVLRSGRRYELRCFRAMACPGETDGPRVGLTTSRRVGNAVFRNRIRRLARDAVRRVLVPSETKVDVVLIARHGLPQDLGQEQVDRDIRDLIQRLREKPPHAQPRQGRR